MKKKTKKPENNKNKQLIELILSYIIKNSLKVGDKLPPEEELAERFSVSRVSIREALQGLKFLGIIKSSTRRGTVIEQMDFSILSRCISFQLAVSEISRKELLEARLAIELGAIELICGKLTSKQIRELYRHTEPEGDWEQHVRTDADFHRTLLKFSGNTVLEAYSDLLELFFLYLEEEGLKPENGGYQRVADEHRKITDALASGNLDYARGLMKQHLRYHMTNQNKG